MTGLLFFPAKLDNWLNILRFWGFCHFCQGLFNKSDPRLHLNHPKTKHETKETGGSLTWRGRRHTQPRDAGVGSPQVRPGVGLGDPEPPATDETAISIKGLKHRKWVWHWTGYWLHWSPGRRAVRSPCRGRRAQSERCRATPPPGARTKTPSSGCSFSRRLCGGRPWAPGWARCPLDPLLTRQQQQIVQNHRSTSHFEVI